MKKRNSRYTFAKKKRVCFTVPWGQGVPRGSRGTSGVPYGAKLDVVKEEVRVVPVGQGGGQGGPIWSWWKSGGFQFVRDEVRGVPVGQGGSQGAPS